MRIKIQVLFFRFPRDPYTQEIFLNMNNILSFHILFKRPRNINELLNLAWRQINKPVIQSSCRSDIPSIAKYSLKIKTFFLTHAMGTNSACAPIHLAEVTSLCC